MRLSPLVKEIEPSPTLLFSQKARELQAQGIDVCNLSAGEPDLPTHPLVCEAASAFLQEGYIQYTSVAGTKELREKIAWWLREYRGYEYSTDEILVGTGAKQCIYEAILSLIGPGDEVLIPSPYWVSYPDQVSLAGGKPVIIKTSSKDDFQITRKMLQKKLTSYTKMLILNSPNNPTGIVYHPDTVKEISEFVLENNLLLFLDEIYDELYFGERPISPLSLYPELKERTILINGFSKNFSMTGWRLGYMAAPKEIVYACESLQGAITSGTSSLSQKAGIAALSLPQTFFENNRAIYQKRMEVICRELQNIEGVRVVKPEGAFYVFPDFSSFLVKKQPNGRFLETTHRLTHYLLETAHVACVPGESFGAPGHLRFSYANNEDFLIEAVRRIASALSKLS